MQCAKHRLLVRWAQTRTNLISDIQALAMVCQDWALSSWPSRAALWILNDSKSPHLISCDQIEGCALPAEAPTATNAVQVCLKGRVPPVALRWHVVVHDQCNLKRTAAKPWHSCE